MQVGVGLGDGFAQGPDGVAHLEAGVPEEVDDFLHGGGFLGVGLAARVEKHDVHIAEGIHLAASVTAEGDDREAFGFRFAELLRANLRENAAEQDVDEVAALAHDFASARAARNAQAQTVFLEAAETAVGFEGFGRGFALRAALEIFGSARQDFF